MSDPGYIPFNRPSIVGKELEYIVQAVQSGRLSGGGDFTRRCEQWLEEHYGAHKVLLTHSCTAALEMAALLCDLREGDEVIMPSFTFVSTANAVALRGAIPVFVDIRPDTLNLDERLLEQARSERTRAVVPVHYGGVGCDMGAIRTFAVRHRLFVIEDAAQGLGAKYDGRDLGTIGDFGCWSFHETKNLISGEGGALVIRDPELVERAEMLREKGTDRSRFFRGEVDRYTWRDLGSSYIPSELVAAFLFAQLERASEIIAKRRRIFSTYEAALAPLQAEGLLQLPQVPPECEPNGHLFYILLASESTRDSLLAHLNGRGVNAVFHYVPLHESPAGRRLSRTAGVLPWTENISRRLLRLPCYFELTEEQQMHVADEIRRFFAGFGETS